MNLKQWLKEQEKLAPEGDGYEAINVDFTTKELMEIKSMCERRNISLNEFVLNCLKDALEDKKVLALLKKKNDEREL